MPISVPGCCSVFRSDTCEPLSLSSSLPQLIPQLLESGSAPQLVRQTTAQSTQSDLSVDSEAEDAEEVALSAALLEDISQLRELFGHDCARLQVRHGPLLRLR